MAQLMDVSGLPVTCSSQEALRLYNETLGHVLSAGKPYFDQLKTALELDPGFIMARCLVGSILCDPFRRDDSLSREYLDILKEAYSNALDREKLHIDAFKVQVEGNLPKACQLYDQITVEYPKDLQATGLAFGNYLTIGEFERMRSLMSRSILHISKDNDLYPYVLSLYAFTLEETNERQYAEELCRESLSLQPVNAWGTHTLAHVIEDIHDVQKGIDFLTSTRSDWKDCLLSHHITWHLTLFYFDRNETDKILEEFDTVMAPQIKPGTMFQLLDSSSLFWRLNLMGIDPGEERWRIITDAFKVQVGNPAHSWLETHLMMSLSYGKVTECNARLVLARQVIKSMEEYSQSSVSSDCTIADMLGVPVCNALLAYGEERYDDVLSLMIPLRYDFIKFGGSWAQRQVFEITMIMAAVNGNKLHEALALITELKARKPYSKLLQRLYDRVNNELMSL